MSLEGDAAMEIIEGLELSPSAREKVWRRLLPTSAEENGIIFSAAQNWLSELYTWIIPGSGEGEREGYEAPAATLAAALGSKS